MDNSTHSCPLKPLGFYGRWFYLFRPLRPLGYHFRDMYIRRALPFLRLKESEVTINSIQAPSQIGCPVQLVPTYSTREVSLSVVIPTVKVSLKLVSHMLI